MTCEKCWGDAAQLVQQGTLHGRPPPLFVGAQVEWYHALLTKRREHPCSPREQAGQFWDDEQQVDRRLTAPTTGRRVIRRRRKAMRDLAAKESA